MKPSHLALALCLALTSARADTDLTREQGATIKSVDAEQLQNNGPLYDGQIVKLKFNRREPETKVQADGSLQGTASLYNYSWGVVGHAHDGDVAVTVPKEGVPWFMKITTKYDAPKSNVAYARISSKSGRPKAELLGLEVKTDIKGSHIVWASH